MNMDVFSAALKNMQSTWKTFAITVGGLNLAFLIDGLSGFSFLRAGGEIEIGGFKVVREALSASYGLLFTVFVVTAFLESRTVKVLCAKVPDGSVCPEETEAILWLLSPFSSSKKLRGLFWFLFADGFFFLAIFSVIHLLNWSPPPLPVKAGTE